MRVKTKILTAEDNRSTGESMRDVVFRTDPYDHARHSGEIGKRNIAFLAEVRRQINPDNKDLTLVYPASGGDIETSLFSSGAKILILIDEDQHSQEVIDGIKTMDGKIQKKPVTSGNRTEIDFEWEGKSRKVIFYKLTIEPHKLDELPKEVKDGYDIYFEKRQTGIGHSRIQEMFLNCLKIGGFRVADSTIDDNIGLSAVGLSDYFENYMFDSVRLHIHKKTEQKPAIEKLIDFNFSFSEAKRWKNGGGGGISGRGAEYALNNYYDALVKLKEDFDSLPSSLQGELEPKIISALTSPGDMSEVFNSPEHSRRLFEESKTKGRTPSRSNIEYFESDIQGLEDSKDRPTEQQLREFTGRGMGIFVKIWKSGDYSVSP